MAKFDPLKETREWHAATDEAYCLKIEQRLQADGHRVVLVKTLRSPNPQSVMPVRCIFEGPDADPHAERFKPPSEKDDQP